MEELVTCEGTVHSIIFQNAENGYTVLRLLTEEGEVITVVGCIPCVAPGEHLAVSGVPETHPQHGEQLRAVELERSLHTFIHAALRVILWMITLCIVLDYVGVPMTSLVAVLSVIGLAVSLAIQGTLSNLAGGIQVLLSKPFKAGDYVEAGGISGTVQEVGLAYTKLCTVDNKVISVPNGQISGEKIINYSTEERRRVDLTFNASYDSPLQQVTGVLRAVVAAHPMALAEPEPFVRVNAYRDSSIEYVVRVWCATGDYWTLYYDLLEQVKEAFDQNGIEMTYNHLNVHLMERERSEP